MKNIKEPLVSIFTCIYNREDKIERVFKSIKNQTYKNIEHIIVDDGSFDASGSMCTEYMQSVSYPVIVVHQFNKGKHGATNVAWDTANGDYIMQLDSDDELLPHAAEYLVNLWDEIPKGNKDKYWWVIGRCRTQKSNEILGKCYPDNINQLEYDKVQKLAQKVKCEEIGLMKSIVLNSGKYRYPEPDCVSFVPEGYLWRQIDKDYRTWYSNEIVRIYYIDEGECLSNPVKNKQSCNNKCWYYRWSLLNRKELKSNFLRDLVIYSLFFPFTDKQYKKRWNYYDFGFKKDKFLSFLLPIFRICGIILMPITKKVFKIQSN